MILNESLSVKNELGGIIIAQKNFNYKSQIFFIDLGCDKEKFYPLCSSKHLFFERVNGEIRN